ncbi:MAG: hypothetical protein ACRDG7_08125 [Candidatus Limnocylindria bacterium]
MTDREFVIELEDEAEGHAGRGIVETDDAAWLDQKLRSDSGTKRLRVLPDDRDDTEGHASDILVQVLLEDEDDTEGHAIAIHFPSRAEADAFRRRLLVTGVLVGTVALGAAGGVGLSALQTDGGATGANSAAIQVDANYQAAAAAEAERQGAAGAALQAQANYEDASAAVAERQAGSGAAAQTGPLDAHEAPAFEGTNLSAADQAYADRLSGQAAGTQVGPMDAHEAPAFQQSATTTDADRDIGIMDRSGADAATQVGPMDAHEAPAFQSSTTDDGEKVRGTGGPTPR